MATYEVEVEIKAWPDGGYVAEVPILPGCWVVGATLDEAIRDIREAIEMHIQGRRKMGWALPEGLRELGTREVPLKLVFPVSVP